MTLLIDTHCHLDLIAEQGVSPTQALEQAEAGGLTAVVQIATDLESSRFNESLADTWNRASRPLRLCWTAGLHPENGERLDQLDSIFDLIRQNRDRHDFLGIGETGLDYFHSTEHVGAQRESFRRHLDLAVELSLPVVVHTRDDRQYSPEKTRAMQDALAMVRERPELTGVLHCFTYSYEEAMPFVELGWKVSFSGILTFKNSHVLHEAAVRLPLACIMVETDAPFLAPAPHRGKLNLPAYSVHTLDFLARLRAERLGEDFETIRVKIGENSLAFLHSKEKITPRAQKFRV